ncbi:MAG: hypothetical protein K2N05_02840 [Muribaculaceae bacterium]|nr:hypothetical protein [Muribaculaceae bacterium]
MHIFHALDLSAQVEYEYLPILEIGKEWKVEFKYDKSAGRDDYISSFRVTEKTIINDEECFVVRETEEKENGKTTSYYLRESNKRLYFGHIDSSSWDTLLDFDCEAGEYTINSMPTVPFPGWKVDETGFSIFHGIRRRYLKFSDFYFYPVYWIEGIGSPNCDFLYSVELPTCPDTEPIPRGRIIECRKDDKLLFHIDNYKSLNVEEILEPIYPDSETIYDLHGRKVNADFYNGIVIKGSKIYYQTK